MHFIYRLWFLNCSVQRAVGGGEHKVNSILPAYYPLPHRYKVNLLRTGGGGRGAIRTVGPGKYTLQRQNTENSKQIFPAKELQGLQSQFLHSCFCERFILYIPVISLPILLQENRCSNVVGIYRSLTDTWMWKVGLRPRKFFSGIT